MGRRRRERSKMHCGLVEKWTGLRCSRIRDVWGRVFLPHLHISLQTCELPPLCRMIFTRNGKCVGPCFLSTASITSSTVQVRCAVPGPAATAETTTSRSEAHPTDYPQKLRPSPGARTRVAGTKLESLGGYDRFLWTLIYLTAARRTLEIQGHFSMRAPQTKQTSSPQGAEAFPGNLLAPTAAA